MNHKFMYSQMCSSGFLGQWTIVPDIVQINQEKEIGLLGQIIIDVSWTISPSNTECNIDTIIFC